MKGKPPFILYSNPTNFNSKLNIPYKYVNQIKKILKRIPDKVLKERPEVENAINQDFKPYFLGIKENKKPEPVKMNSSMKENKRKFISEKND